MIPLDLRHFVPSEFKNPDLVANDAAYFLDSVRTRYGSPLVVTSDARTPEENDKVGGSITSLHLVGRAFDLRWIPDPVAAYAFLAAVVHTNDALGPGVELELDLRKSAKHFHVGVYPSRHPSRLVIQQDEP